MPGPIHSLLCSWMTPGYLTSQIPWRFPLLWCSSGSLVSGVVCNVSTESSESLGSCPLQLGGGVHLLSSGVPVVGNPVRVSRHRSVCALRAGSATCFLMRQVCMQDSDPAAYSKDWNRWEFIYLRPPLTTSVMLQVVLQSRTFWGRMLLVMPLWRAQLWCITRMVPQPIPVERRPTQGVAIAMASRILGTSRV